MRVAVVLVVLALGSTVSPEPAFTPLFDGKSLAGWTAIGCQPGNWRVESGMLVSLGDGKGWLSTNRAYGDFEIKLEYQLGRAGNSGVLIRAPHPGDPSYEGLEVQILDDEAPVYRNLRPSQYTGSVYDVMASQRGHAKPAGQWNVLRIKIQGSAVVVELNGQVILDGDTAAHPQALARHPGLSRLHGFVGLQSHASPVQFREIQIREIR